MGGNAKYHRTALTPQEADFSKARKDNRDEIFIGFGIPPQLGGAQESSTYNNFDTSLLIFWVMTLIPIMDNVKSELNFSFNDELSFNEKFNYDLSGVDVIRKAMLDSSETAERLFNMGVSFENINKVFNFGVDEFEGWDKSYVKIGSTSNGQEETEEPVEPIEPDQEEQEEDRNKFTLLEYRANLEEEIEEKALKNAKIFERLLSKRQARVFKQLEQDKNVDMGNIIAEDEQDWENELEKMYLDTGVEFGLKVIEQRQAVDVLKQIIMRYLLEEIVVLKEKTNMAENDAKTVTE